MMSKMKDMGGTENFQAMFEKMAKGMGGLGKNMRMDTNALNRMTAMEGTRNRMRTKLQQKKEQQLAAIEKLKADRKHLFEEQSKALVGSPYSLETVAPENMVFRIQGEEVQEKTMLNKLRENADKMADLLIAEEDTAPKTEKKSKKKNKKTK
jgi:hypothetical protein